MITPDNIQAYIDCTIRKKFMIEEAFQRAEATYKELSGQLEDVTEELKDLQETKAKMGV